MSKLTKILGVIESLAGLASAFDPAISADVAAAEAAVNAIVALGASAQAAVPPKVN